jgi:molecular chaperone GrpE
MPKTKKTSAKKKHEQNLDQLIDKVNDLDDKWRRALADYDNLEKRFAQEKESITKFLNAGLVEKILVIVDDLERAADHIKDKGLTMILHKLVSLLKSEGLAEITAAKQPFDPVTMDCVDLVKGTANTVTDVVQKGYMFNGRVLRPAKVKVGKGGSGGSDNKSE